MGFEIQSSGHYYGTGESARRCVSCGQPLEHVLGADGVFRADHHCSATHVRLRDAASARLEEPIVRLPPWAQRLNEGFEMLDEDMT
jgi:hypothetical protein